MGEGEVSEIKGSGTFTPPPACSTSLSLLKHANSLTCTIPVHTVLAALRSRLLQMAAVRPAAKDLTVIVDISASLMERDAVIKLEAMRIGDHPTAFCAIGRSLPEPEAASLEPAASHASF
ncbi:hypothetical protein PshuTeo2_05720 [Pseudomonas hunanensis]|nr:hypothetical protein [Pseudomonas hunanensis]